MTGRIRMRMFAISAAVAAVAVERAGRRRPARLP